VGVSLTLFSLGNLIALARTHRFTRYVVALIGAGTVFVPIAIWLSGGITVASAGTVWAFLIPAYALLALGPSQAGRWFGAFIAIVIGSALLELALGIPTTRMPLQVSIISAAFSVIAPLTIVFGMMLYSDRRRREAEARSDELLTNAIPATIARRLRHGEKHIADVYAETTVLFTDIVDFTPWAQRTEPTRVAMVLDDLFSRFDQLVSSAGLEKIKTIGDAYMAVSGAPKPRSDHAQAALDVAFGMLDAAEIWRRLQGVPLDIRIGMASGPVAGGVIGERRILFDLWGDTVNTAARMESNGLSNAVQITDSTRRLLASDVRTVQRDIDVKGIGPMAAYLVVRT
jgi:adenylate cyclase